MLSFFKVILMIEPIKETDNDSVCERKVVAMLLEQGKLDLEMYDIEDYF